MSTDAIFAASLLAGAGMAEPPTTQDFKSCHDLISNVEIFSDRPRHARPWSNFFISARRCFDGEGHERVNVAFRDHMFSVVDDVHVSAKLYVLIVDDDQPILGLWYGSDNPDEQGNFFDYAAYRLDTSAEISTGRTVDLPEFESLRAMAEK